MSCITKTLPEPAVLDYGIGSYEMLEGHVEINDHFPYHSIAFWEATEYLKNMQN